MRCNAATLVSTLVFATLNEQAPNPIDAPPRSEKEENELGKRIGFVRFPGGTDKDEDVLLPSGLLPFLENVALGLWMFWGKAMLPAAEVGSIQFTIVLL